MDKTMDTREKLLYSGLELFATKSYEGVGIQEIVQSVGVKKPTLYHYFGSKLGFYTSIIEYFGQKYIALSQNCCVYRRDLVFSLNSLASQLIASALNDPHFFGLLMQGAVLSPSAEHYDATRKYLHDFVAPLEALFLASEQEHGNIRGKSKVLSRSFLGHIWVNLYSAQEHSSQELETLPFALVKQFMYGIFA
ncbi:MAG: TetR/AcrR family transcriptional regulator [Bradymonadales bacterium]